MEHNPPELKDKAIYVLIMVNALLTGLLSGGALYEQMVLNSEWSAKPPESFRFMTDHILPSLQKHDFYLITSLAFLLTIILIITVSRKKEKYRSWLIIAGISMTILVVWTFAYFIPVLTNLLIKPNSSLGSEEVAEMAWHWYLLNWGRVVLALISFFAAFMAATAMSVHLSERSRRQGSTPRH